MDRLAVDVVIVPETATRALAIETSAAIAAASTSAEIILNDETMTPHLSLGMAAVRIDEIVELGREIEALARRHPVMLLEAHALSVGSGVPPSVLLDIRPTSPLRALHEDVAALLREFCIAGDPPATPEMFAGDLTIGANSLWWVDHYLTDRSGDAFSPHVTLGQGSRPEEFEVPFSFESGPLAVFQLGAHCTCHTRLASFALAG